MIKYCFSLLILLLATALNSFAAEHPDTQPVVVLDSLARADAFARDRLQELREEADSRHAKITAVELYHVGDDAPAELEALTRWFKQAGLRVFYHQVNRAQIDQLVDEQSEKLAPIVPGLYDVVKYDPRLAKTPLAPIPTTTEIKSRLKHLFGVPGGISFMTYAVKRTAKEKLIEAGVALAKVSITSFVIYHSLAAKAAAGENLNIALPIVVSAAFSLGFDYWQRGNNAFKGQGYNFDFTVGHSVMNKKFYLTTALIHSIVVREAIMAAAHVTSHGFTLGWAAAWAAMHTSIKGLLGKSPVEMFITRGQRNHSPWWTIGWMTAWGSFYASLQILDMFEVGQVFRTALTVLGTTGLVFELYKDRVALYTAGRRFMDAISGRVRAAKCETLLVYKEKET